MDRGLLWWALKSSGGVVVMMVHCSIFNGRQYWDVLAFPNFFFSFFFSLITFVYCLLSRRRHTVSTTYLLHYTVPIVEGCQLPKILSEQSALIFS